MSGLERAEVLNRLADLIRDNRERLVRIEVEEAGKPIRFARGDIDGAVGLTRYAASLAMQMAGSTYTNLGAKQDGAGHARADRRRGSRHAVEFPGIDPVAEGAFCARRRLHGRAEALGIHLRLGFRNRRAGGRSGRARPAPSTSSAAMARQLATI